MMHWPKSKRQKAHEAYLANQDELNAAALAEILAVSRRIAGHAQQIVHGDLFPDNPELRGTAQGALDAHNRLVEAAQEHKKKGGDT